MKKLIFAVAALVAMTSCHLFGDKNVEKCDNVEELQKAVTEASTDTARYDINGDGKVDAQDVDFLKAKAEEGQDAKQDANVEEVKPETEQAQPTTEQAQPAAEETTEAPAEQTAK